MQWGSCLKAMLFIRRAKRKTISIFPAWRVKKIKIHFNSFKLLISQLTAKVLCTNRYGELLFNIVCALFESDIFVHFFIASVVHYNIRSRSVEVNIDNLTLYRFIPRRYESFLLHDFYGFRHLHCFPFVLYSYLNFKQFFFLLYSTLSHTALKYCLINYRSVTR